eukprot:TRINITY_DN1714_c1_g1_i1.p1 TRINITY_DN1714_c1_g1~~TRINITY_DN1714_c1_g1_i1.p1  ORF type:complete len:304 (-),score=75.17 TRINITY_DN1714_c1_g1_i1:260-1171(-)
MSSSSTILRPIYSDCQTARKAYEDPVIFRDDRVLQILLSKESNYVPMSRPAAASSISLSTEGIQPPNRREVADWMLEICEDTGVSPEVFVLAMNYLDRFLGVCSISKSQLQLLGAVCLLVSWKVREHRPLPAVKLVEYSDFNLTLMDIMEWEVLLLSKLDWDMSSVIASDFLEHIVQRLSLVINDGSISLENVRRDAEARILFCSSHHGFSSYNPSFIAIASVLGALQPLDNDRLKAILSIFQGFKPLECTQGTSLLALVDKIQRLMTESSSSSSSKSSKNTSDELTTPTKLHDVVATKYARH